MTTATQPFAGTFVADPVHSSIEFAVRHMKVSLFRARFEEVSARVDAGPDGIRLEGSVPVESVSIRSPREFREHVVHGADFFDAGNHPRITVRSDEVTLHEDGTVTVRGEVTLRGITRPVTATGSYEPPVEDPYGARRAALALTATVDRRDWGMDWQAPLPAGGDVLSYDVQLSAHLELVQEA